MKKLPKTLRKNGFDYELVTRNNTYAVYKQKFGDQCSYEVFRINIIEAGTKIFNTVYEETEEFMPGNEEFGKSAWSIREKDRAIERFEFLTKVYPNGDLKNFADMPK